ncbi:MAG: hypothetical protein K2M17_03360, partial [Bacilli bacterium]|nr:hypothetical protein [Bacilli bacterium]
IEDIDYLKKKEESLIKYLEYQINLYEKDIRNFSKDYKVYYLIITEERKKLEAYQDILERIKSGKYE